MDPKLVSDAVDLLMKNPEAELDVDDPAFAGAVAGEYNRRKALGIDIPKPFGQKASDMADAAVDPNGYLGAALHSAGQGYSGGWIDEAVGALPMIASGGASAPAYQDTRDDVRAAYDQSYAAHPVVSTAAMMAGAAANPLMRRLPIPVQGAVMGAGMSKADLSNTTGIREFQDDMKGGTLGAIAGAELVKSGANAAGRAMDAIKKKAADSIANWLGIPVGSTEYMRLLGSGLIDDYIETAAKQSEFPYSRGDTVMNIRNQGEMGKAAFGDLAAPEPIPLEPPPVEQTTAQKIWKMERGPRNVPVPEGPPAQHPKAWGNPANKPPTTIDFGPDEAMGSGAPGSFNEPLANFHGEGQYRSGSELYSRASSYDLNNMAPAHPAASQPVANVSEMGARSMPGGAPVGNPAKIAQPDVGAPGVMMPAKDPEIGKGVQGLLQKQIDKEAGTTGLQGFQPGGPIASTWQAVKPRLSSFAGFGMRNLANAMTAILESGSYDPAASQALGGGLSQYSQMLPKDNTTLRNLVNAVQNSDDPEMDDYLAQEQSPEYRALRAAAQERMSKDASR